MSKSSIILPSGYKPGTGADKRTGESLEVDPSAPRALTAHAVREQLASLARLIGEIYHVKMSVALRGRDLFFVDDVGDNIIDRGGNRPPIDVICASQAEIEDGMFLQLFAGRAMWAAASERMNMASRGEL